VNSPIKERKDVFAFAGRGAVATTKKATTQGRCCRPVVVFFFVVRVARSHTTTMAFGVSRAASDLRTFGRC
jgi:hypothetical protein